MNWTEQILYDQNQVAISDSRTYTDGFGNAMQSQSKDFISGKVWGTQTLFNSFNAAAGGTLPAPILESEFIYKQSLASNSAGQPYSANDFDLRSTNGSSGEVTNPKPFGTQPGTVGWYYSSANDLEKLTPTTQYPYSRSYAPEGPDPTTSTTAGPGDQYKMGSGHETKSDRYPIASGELAHYYSLGHFFNAPLYYIPSTLLSINDASANQSLFAPYQSVSVSTIPLSRYLIVTSGQSTGNPGVYPINGSISVTPGMICSFQVQGFVMGSGTVKLHVTDGVGNDILWGSPLTSTSQTVTSSFTVPAGITSIKVGIQWTSPVSGEYFVISRLVLQGFTPSDAPGGSPGYKYITTDANGKKAVSFVDADGRALASALVTGGTAPNFTYDYWSYTYYNDAGQVTATVAPNGVNTASTALPGFVTYFKYDQLGRLIETTSPDEGTSRFVYSTDGKIRFSENEVQRSATPKRFSYTNYDYLGRLTESGEYTRPAGAGGYVFEPHTTATPASLSVLNIIDNNFTVPVDQVSGANYTGVSYKLDAAHCSEYTFITYDIPGSGSPAVQLNLYGQVSKTQNATATTWYSYDEFGQLTWTKQLISGLGTKTIDYTYDYFGNVTQVAYQAGQPDKFYHHYEYDKNNRLVNTYTSFDGANKTLQAKYLYYLHGPLKRVELANNLQGIDYVYTIDGALKSINHSDVANDPGKDGDGNGFSKDVFGEMLSYYDNDYTGASYAAGNVTTAGIANNYNGLIKSSTWFTPVDNGASRKAYGYTYDSRYQLQNAQFGTVTSAAGNYTAALSASAYNENIPGYDKNGNIQNLVRKGKTGNTLGSYGYTYTPSTNKVATITNSGNAMMSYTYNAIGQMTQQVEAGVATLKVAYNAYGLVKEVRDGTDKLTVSYDYDDRGDRVKNTTYTSGSASKNTFYVHDASGNPLAIYEQALPSGAPVLVELPIYGAGRIGEYKPATSTTFYEMNDHLGNVRAVIGAPKTDTYTATMETENATVEDAQFKNIAPRVVSTPANNTVGGNEAVRLNYARPAGPGISLKVAPGDVITVETYAYYEGGSGYSNTLPLATIVNAAAGIFGGVNGAIGDPGKIYNAFNADLGGGFAGAAGSGNDAVPAGYLNMIMFDNNLLTDATLPMSAIPVTVAANFAKEKLTISLGTAANPITAPGYVYIYVNNNSNSANYVYFDDLKVTHLHSPFVAGSDFYPFGLTMSDRDITKEPYRFGYQGQYAEEDTVTGWNNFELRQYDARFGRWISADPYGQFASPYIGMGNNPVSGVDPDGGLNLGGAFARGLQGFAIGSLVGLAVDNDNWWKYGVGLGAAGFAYGLLSPTVGYVGSESGFDKFRENFEYAFTGKGGKIESRNGLGQPETLKFYPPFNDVKDVNNGFRTSFKQLYKKPITDWLKTEGAGYASDVVERIIKSGLPNLVNKINNEKMRPVLVNVVGEDYYGDHPYARTQSYKDLGADDSKEYMNPGNIRRNGNGRSVTLRIPSKSQPSWQPHSTTEFRIQIYFQKIHKK